MWMYSVNQPGESKNFDEKTVQLLKQQVFTLLYNVLAFYELYRDKNLEENEPKSKNVLDLWILSRLNELISFTTQSLDNYKLMEPVRAIRDFINDLSTWYLRRSRERIKEGDKDAKETLYYALKTLAKVMAPFAPFAAEDIWLKLRNERGNESVHLESWPKAEKVNRKIIEQMSQAREVVTFGLQERQKAQINVRQPLPKLTTTVAFQKEFNVIVADELNIKEIVRGNENKLSTEITSELKQEGEYRELVRAVQDLRKKARLTPKDKIKLFLPAKYRDLTSKFETDLQKAVWASEIKFTDQEEIKIE